MGANLSTLDEIAGSLEPSEELSRKPLSDGEVMAAIKSRLRSEDIETMSAPESTEHVAPLCSQNNEWHIGERREILLLALLPFFSSVVLTLFWFSQLPWLLVVVFTIFMAIFGYASLFIGVMPLLLMFRRLKWNDWFHCGLAGYAGVVIVWLVPVLIYSVFQSTQQFNVIGLPALIQRTSEPVILNAFKTTSQVGGVAAIGFVLFWFLTRRWNDSKK